MNDRVSNGGGIVPLPVPQDAEARLACAAWLARREEEEGELPCLPARAQARPAALLFLDELHDSTASHDWPEALAWLVRDRTTTITGPMRFRAVLDGNDGSTGWTGLLLPFADETGRVVAVELVMERHWTSVAAVIPALSTIARSNPWRRPADHTALPPPSLEERLADARLWIALASASPVCRAQALPRALEALIAGAEAENGREQAEALIAAWPADARAELAGALAAARPAEAQEGLAAEGATRPAAVSAGRLDLAPVDLARLTRRTPHPRAWAALAA